MPNKLNIEGWDSLSKEEQEYALKILNEMAADGKSAALESLDYADFEEIPVDIHTFMHDPRFLGRALYDQDGRFTVFPYWEKKLEEIFPDNVTTKYNTIIFTGAIGLGKSTIAVICLLYLLYRLLCLRDPYLYYGMQPIDKLTISLMNITLENAKGVALDKMNQMILQSDWFLSHGDMGGTTNLQFHPNKHIEIVAASSNNQIIGRALFCNFTDEVNFGLTNDVEKLKKKQKTLISQVDARMKSRFLRTKPDGTAFLPTLNIIASSKNSEQSFLDEFINTKKKNESTTTLIVDEPQWIVDQRKDSPIKFWVAVGNKFLANELLPLDITDEELDVYRGKGYQLIHVPIGYLDNFQDNIDGALTDIAGIATASSLKYISGLRLNQIKTSTYKNPFSKDIIEVGNSKDDHLQYANFFDISQVSQEDMAKPMFIHLDMSITGDKTGIAGVWITGKRPTPRNLLELPTAEFGENNTAAALEVSNQYEENISRELQYKLAFSVSIKAPKGFQVSFEKTRNFIRWLRDRGFTIKGISADTFQSATMLQELTTDGFKTHALSVDRVDRTARLCIPYHYLKSAIYEGRISMYQKCDLLTDELIGLERLSDGHIDHTSDGINSKDQSDAFCGAVYTASQYAEEYTYAYGDNLAASLDVSIEETAHEKRTQMIMSFEEELTKIYKELDDEQTSRQRDDYEFYSDIADGIIVI